jgi:GNAT superfamily N-acetyltransferase
LAKKIKDYAVIDEFTSVVDRTVAKAASLALNKYVRNKNIKNIIIATCHEDILEWLEPDWIFNTNNGELLVGRCLRRPLIVIEIYPCKYTAWEMFKNYHYLRNDLLRSARCFMATWSGKVVGFASSITMPSGSLKNAWREHRTVILPDYQGMGIGTLLSDTIAQIHVDEGKRYYSRTAHPRMGIHRDHSPFWRKTSKYKMLRTDALKKDTNFNNYKTDVVRVCYSHEFIGTNHNI